MTTWLVGIDCAAQHKNVGLALGRLDRGDVSVMEVATGEADVGLLLARWAREFEPKIYALDAPLGWPGALGGTLHNHDAGDGVGPTSHELFRRRTDDFVYARLRKRPLEVGADRIARAAVTTLKALEQLRAETGLAVPLLWEPKVPPAPGAIEVYPAATLLARGLDLKGYKGRRTEHRQARERLVRRLSGHLNLEVDAAALAATDHALDAAVCVLAAADFARGWAHGPGDEDETIVRKEGWIWFADAGERGGRRQS